MLRYSSPDYFQNKPSFIPKVTLATFSPNNSLAFHFRIIMKDFFLFGWTDYLLQIIKLSIVQRKSIINHQKKKNTEVKLRAEMHKFTEIIQCR